MSARSSDPVFVSATDRILIDHVRPPGWVNPAPATGDDLVVLGGGTAGLVSAMGAAGLGAQRDAVAGRRR